MKEIIDERLLKKFISQFSIDKLFSIDMTPFMKLFSFAEGEKILQMGNSIEYLYLHVKGTARIYATTSNGKSLMLRFSRPLMALGEVEMFESKNIICTAEAVTECLLIGIKEEVIKKRCYDDPTFLRFIIGEMIRKVRGTASSAHINQLNSIRDRLICYISSWEDDENNTKKNKEIKTYKIQEIALLLGASYRHLNRIINELVKEGILGRSRGKIFVANLRKLKQLSTNDIYE